jgi:hypothetical protein
VPERNAKQMGQGMFVVIGLIVAFVLVVLFSRPDMRRCRWRADRRGDRDGHAKFVCVACGAVTFTTDGKPPRFCAEKTKGAPE